MAKSPDAFRTISEVSEWLDTPAHVLRFWESKFPQIRPVKRAGGRRYYRPDDMTLLGGIKSLLHEDGMTIKGVQKLLRDHGVGYVSDRSQPLDGPDGSAEIIDVTPVTVTPLAELPDDWMTDPTDEDGSAAPRALAFLALVKPDELRAKAKQLTPFIEKLTAMRDHMG